MCSIHTGFRKGVATAVKRLICLKVKCSRSITLRAQTSQSKVWKSCQLNPGLHSQRISWTPRLRGSHSCRGALMVGHEPLPHGHTPTVMPRSGAVLVLDRVVRWTLDFQRGPIALLPREPWHPNAVQSSTSHFLHFFFLALKRNCCRAVMIHE